MGTRALSILCLPAMMLFGCAHAEEALLEEERNFGHKQILLGPATDVSLLARIVNEWDEVSAAIYRFQPRPCLEGLSANSISSVALMTADARWVLDQPYEELPRRLVVSVGTANPCVQDPAESDIAWIMILEDGRYEVIDLQVLSE